MTFTDFGIVVLCAVIGWGIVSWIISIVQQQKQPPLDLTGGSPAPRDRPPLRGLPAPDAASPPPPEIAAPAPPSRDAPFRAPPSRAPPSPAPPHDAAAPPSRGLSLAEISARWSTILRVPDSASAQEIEAAYHAGIAECDRMRFAPDASPTAKSAAEARRAQITQAFEFIRPLKN